MTVNGRNRGGLNGYAERDPGIERLYREAAGETPPAHLDAAILAAARREAGARPRSIGPKLRRWHVPVSIAAVLVVTVSLVVLMREERPMLMMRDEGTLLKLERETLEEGRRRIEEADAPPGQATHAEAQQGSRQPPAAAPESPRRESRDDTKPSAGMGKPADEPRLRMSRPASVPDESTLARMERAGKPMSPPVQTLPPGVDEERAASAKADTVAAGKVAASPATPSEPQAARSTADAPPAKPVAGGPMPRYVEQARPPVWRGFEKEPPEKWLAHIEELRKQGRVAEAEEMLSEFKRRFPAHSVPSGSK